MYFQKKSMYDKMSIFGTENIEEAGEFRRENKERFCVQFETFNENS